MKIDGRDYRSVWVDADDRWSVHILDQTKLPWSLEVLRLTNRDEAAHAIKSMQTRGAPLIGAVAAYGLCLALRTDASTEAMERDAELLNATRPTDYRVIGDAPHRQLRAAVSRRGHLPHGFVQVFLHLELALPGVGLAPHAARARGSHRHVSVLPPIVG